MTHIFISYSHKNRAFAKHLEAALQTSGYPVWRDESHGVTHHNWQADVLAALDNTSVMIVILSPESLASDPVDFEIKTAQARGIPIVAIQYIPSAQHKRLKAVPVVDFTHINSANQQKNDFNSLELFVFARLLQELDNALPMLHYLGQLFAVDARLRRAVAMSAGSDHNQSVTITPQTHPHAPFFHAQSA